MRRSRGEKARASTREERAGGARVIPLPDGPHHLVGERGPLVVGVMSDARPEVRERWLWRPSDAGAL